MGLRRGYKRDTRGRFSRTAGSKGTKSVAKRSSPKRKRSALASHKAARRAIAQHKASKLPKLTTAQANARRKKIRRNVNIARAVIIAGAVGAQAYGAHQAASPTLATRRMHAHDMGQRM
jgi:hypothetical protein